MKGIRRVSLTLALALSLVISVVAFGAVPVYAAENYDSKVNSFINDSRWCNGISWGDSQTPKLSTHKAWSCYAYVCDYSKYMYGLNQAALGTAFDNRNGISELRSGDVVKINNTPHYIIILYRNGDKLTTAEGNASQKVRIGDNYYTASSLSNYVCGWHYDTGEIKGGDSSDDPSKEKSEYDGDKSKYQTLIDAMIEASKLDAFGKPAYTWTLPELTDYVNAQIPNMKKEEREYDITYKNGAPPAKGKIVSYQGSNGNAHGSIMVDDMTFADGSMTTQKGAGFFILNGSNTIDQISSSDDVVSNGHITSRVEYGEKKIPAKLSLLQNALAMIDDPDLISYMNTEREIGNSRKIIFSDETSLIFTPNENIGYVGNNKEKTVDASIRYAFRNHSFSLHYRNGKCDLFTYETDYDPTDMYRLYNPNSGEHFYTANREEADNLVAVGWKDEGLGWKAPKMSDTPVYRLYNPNSGDHHYTPNEDERNNLIAAGWSDEGVGWYSFERQTTSLFRLYNPNAAAGTHHYTTDKEERDFLVSNGWVDEGIGWYGM